MPNTQVALQGVHAMLDPGLYPLRLDVTSAGWLGPVVRADGADKSGNFLTTRPGS